MQYSSVQKWDIIEKYESWCNDNEGKKLSAYIKENNLPLKYKDYLCVGKTKGWYHPTTREQIFNQAMDKNIWRLKVPGRGRINVSMSPLMETELKGDLIERR